MLKKFYQENKFMVTTGIIAGIIIIGILLVVKNEVDRFIFAMPVFAGWILLNILMLPEEEKEKRK